MSETVERDAILSALRAWIAQRTGASVRDYAHDWRDTAGLSTYRSDMRKVQQQRRDALAMLKALDWREGVTGNDIAAALKDGSDGRLTWNAGRARLDYCTGQCWWMEYRAQACRGLAMVLWRRFREGQPDGDSVRVAVRRELGRGIAARWFN